jgi:hypothetical protein
MYRSWIYRRRKVYNSCIIIVVCRLELLIVFYYNRFRDEQETLCRRLESLQQSINTANSLGQVVKRTALLETRKSLAFRIRSLRLYCNSKGYNIEDSEK